MIRPAIFLPVQLDRITSSHAHSTRESEIVAATSATAIHAPTIAYRIKNAVLIDGSIFVGEHRHLIADKSRFTGHAHEPHHLASAALASTYSGSKHFGHWLCYYCLQYVLANKLSQPLCVRLLPAGEGHQKKYEAILRPELDPHGTAMLGSYYLIIFQDFAQNSLKHKRDLAFRERIKERFPKTGSGGLVYLRRGRTGVPRLIQNETEILDALVNQGFIVVT